MAELNIVPLLILNFIVLAVIAVIVFLITKFVKTQKAKDIVMLVASIATIVCHYSSLVYHQIVNGTCIPFLTSNPNLVYPIYPCNCVMWASFIFALLRNKESKTARLISTYCFFFGVVSGIVGLFANVDFMNNPTLKDYDIFKGVLAHGFMLLNVLLYPCLGYVEYNFKKNIIRMAMSEVIMLIIGAYCTLLFTVINSYETAYQVNSMFLLHSPFEGVKFLIYPFIAAVALAFYALLFFIIDLIRKQKAQKHENTTEE